MFHIHLDLLYTDQEVERIFTPALMALFCSAKKISSYLVRATMHPLESVLVISSVEVDVVRFV